MADPASGPRLSNASITGKVEMIAERERTPVRRARMMLTSTTDRKDIVRFTDGDGRYLFDHLASGSYTIRVDKPGFLPAVIGPSVPRDRPLDLTPDEQITIDFPMVRGAAIEGRFLDQNGLPLRNLTVTASRVLKKGDGLRDWDDESLTLTDDLGQFRLHTLPAGNYMVHAVVPGYRLYFPGVSEDVEASAIPLATGENVSGVDVVMPKALERSRAPGQVAVLSEGPKPTSATRVTGVVVRSDTGAPVPSATVALVSPSSGSGSTAVTDEEGRFETNGAAPDTYVLIASHPAFFVGLDLMSAHAISVNLKEGQTIDLRLTMPMPASVEGRVVDEFGDPVPGMEVAVMQRVFAAGQLRYLPLSTRLGSNMASTTDDRGRFRFFNLMAGDYFLEVIGFPFGQREQGQMMAAGQLPVPVVRTGGFAPTFFPGTDARATAKALHLREGDQLRDVVIPAKPAPLGRLVGQVLDEMLSPVAQSRVLVFKRDGGDMDSFASMTITSGADGSFESRDLPRGDYVIQVLGSGRFGALPVTIEADSAPIAITLHPTRTGRGRIVFDSDGPPPAQSQVRLRLLPTDFMSGPAGGGPNPWKVDDAWQFEITGMASTGVIRMMPLRGWSLRSVKRAGEEILNRPTNFQAEDVAGLEVTLTNRLGSISGTVFEDGRLASNAGVVVFPEDRRLWTLSNGPIVTGRTDYDGAFEIRDVLPGSYLMIAAPPFGFRGEPDPEWLAAHRGLATPIIITERQNTTVSLTLRR